METTGEVDSRTTRREFLSFAGAASGIVLTAGCASSDDQTTSTTAVNSSADASSQETETVSIAQGQFLSTLDPQNHAETATDNILLSAYEQLLFRDREGKIIGELATDWERIEDGRVRFTLREDVQFHSGDLLTPEDAAYSINRIMKEDIGGIVSPQSSSLEPITGAAVVDGERAIDVISEGFNPIVFASLAGQTGQIMQKAWVEERSETEIAKDINGTGPFKLEDYEQDVRILFSRFQNYWREPAALETVEFRGVAESSTRINQLVAGETDLIVNVPPQAVGQIKSSDESDIAAAASLRMLFAAMRYDVEPFSSVKFRQAMNYAVDTQAIVENVLSGFGEIVSQPTQNGVFGHNPDIDPYPRDLEKAETLVEESGHAGVSIELHTPVGRYLKDVEVAQAIAGQIDELPNVNCTSKQRDFATLASEVVNGKISTSPHFYMLGYANAIFDASFVIAPLLTSDGTLTSYKDEEADALMQQAQQERDEKRREQLLQEANTLYHERAPWIFLHQQAGIYGVSNGLEWQPRKDEHIDAYSMRLK